MALIVLTFSCSKNGGSPGGNLAVTVSVPSGFSYDSTFDVYVSAASSGATIASGNVANGGTFTATVNPGDYFVQAQARTSHYYPLYNSEWSCNGVGGCGLGVQVAADRKAVTLSRWCQYRTQSNGVYCN